jgi:hypothetical protein
MHKTGTTSIQNFFSQSREALLESGLCYPTSGCQKGEGAHHNIYRYYTRNADERARFKPNLGGETQLLEEISAVDKDVFLSSEGFWVLARDEPEQFKEFVLAMSRHRQILFVVTWRNAAEYCESLYFQAAKFKQMVGISQAAKWFAAMPDEFKKVINFISNDLDVETRIVQYQTDMVTVFSSMLSDLLSIKIDAARSEQVYHGLSLSPAQKLIAAHLSLSIVRIDDEVYKAILGAVSDGITPPEAFGERSILPEALQKRLLTLSVDGLKEVLKNQRVSLYPTTLNTNFEVRPTLLGKSDIFSFPKLRFELESI